MDTVNNLSEMIGIDNEPSSLKEALNICRSEWSKLLGKESDLKTSLYKRRKVRSGLIGKVSLGQSDRPFCFIIAEDKQSFFCYKSDLPLDIVDGDEVTFDALPSFDRKKNKESWKASNVRRRT